MAASRRGQPPISVRLPQPSSPGLLPDLPPISALFLIDFDVKAGYTITWKRAVPGLDIEGVVEYKSLPSGLHTVPDDLIYFVHEDGYAGLSAFVNTRTEEEETRHARMIAVGVLVPLSYGRLGRAWRHSQGLKDVASALAINQKQTEILERYWEENGAHRPVSPQPSDDASLCSPSITLKTSRPGLGMRHTRNRSASDGTALIPPGQGLSPFHPAWSLLALLDTFGPLIFPIYRAALLRKRILISTHAPVHEVCNFVYDISVLSNIPLPVLDLLDSSAPIQRLKPLFTIGVHDIPSLLESHSALRNPDSDEEDESAAVDDAGSGWIACTTDSILAVKEDLWDMLIVIPPAYTSKAKDKVWPTVECPKGVPVRATQRDLRRFRSLQAGLTRLEAQSSTSATPQPNSFRSPRPERTPPASPDLRRSTSSIPRTGAGERLSPLNDDDADDIVEPSTWAALAYSGFMWWASAGEQRLAEEAEEFALDASLLADLAPERPAMQGSQSFSSAGLTSPGLGDSVSSLTANRASQDGEGATNEQTPSIELAIIAYFHRLTTQMLSVLAEIVETSDEDDMLGVVDPSEDDAGEEMGVLLGRRRGDDTGGSVRVDSNTLAHMGLDMWSNAEADFVRELTARYFGRRAHVQGKGVEVCGMRVC